MTFKHVMPKRNLLLAALPASERDAMKADLEPVDLPLKKQLIEPGQPITHVYFPTSGVMSMVNEPEPGQIVEFGTVGREGFIGVPVILGADRMPSMALVQVAGGGFRMTTKALRKAMQSHPHFNTLLLRYVLAFVNQIAHVASCNRLHEVQERCARWLLQTHDRVEDDIFLLTQEFLGQMLGVHRPTVSVAAGMLQKAGLIEYVRGVITIRDREGLEAASCHCYKLIAREYDRLLNGSG